ncbi:MAG TPA: adenosylcobinamide-GDP ribazoletransferase [Xanthobacteraceae bacterium]|jgi:adenosylcobinamide-GDP ribazoletransferase
MKRLGAWLRTLMADLTVSLLFSTRLPLADSSAIDGRDLARASWALPVAGLGVGAIGAVVYGAMARIGMPSGPAAALALASAMAITGCLHEDGLADTTDGFGGGKDREQKLGIMRDSRLGTYGACALLGSLLLRWSALATIADPRSVAFALIASHAAARAPLPSFMRLVPAARSDGLSAAAGAPSPESAAMAWVIGAAALIAGLNPAAGVSALLLLAAATTAMAWATVRQIGGQTGDVVGALEQVNEVLILLIAAAAHNPQAH